LSSKLEFALAAEIMHKLTRRSTLDQVVRLTQIIEQVLEAEIVCCTVFLDLTAVHDAIWYLGLQQKYERRKERRRTSRNC